jgi:hypothetical protein
VLRQQFVAINISYNLAIIEVVNLAVQQHEGADFFATIEIS